MSSTDGNRAVAAATGRSFKSSRPDFNLGSAGCKPARFGSLPKRGELDIATPIAYANMLPAGAGNYRLAACAPRKRARLPQIWREPLLDFSDWFAPAQRVIHYLIATDPADPEIFCIGMRKIEPAHTGAGMHCKRFR
jgi:hypothetical protein